ncbi:MAG: hypothetical protein HY267_06435 [Deltaproteobacteria bacterium]|nr:hypothetical protein [Deltaproteobacteria bacterium]
MLLILDVDYTLNRFYPPSIREFAPPELLDNNNPQLWDWIVNHLRTVEYPVHETAVEVLQQLNRYNPLVVVSTGRPEALREVTEHWLQQFFQFEHLFMRSAGDFRLNAEVKRDVLTREILPMAEGRPLFAFEDDAGSLQMYQEAGVRPFVAPDCWEKLHPHVREDHQPAVMQAILQDFVLF